VSADARETVASALARWGLEDADASFVAGRENKVYRVRTAAGDFALRLKRPGYRSDAELKSELQWMAAMKQAGLAVPCPEPSLQGRLLEVVEEMRVDLLGWLPGQALGASRAPLQLENATTTFWQLGRATARLHQASDAWRPPPGFFRCSWDLEGLLGETPMWGPFWRNPTLDAETRRILEEFRNQARDAISRASASLDFGLIHADLVRENVMLDGQDIAMIDFDDGGWGYRVFELATTLLKNIDEPNYPELRANLLAGYSSIRAIDMRLLDMFIALRAATYVGWIVPRLHEDGASTRNDRFVSQARLLCGTALDSQS
jgi:Ser/Thr protein kinase RdoA (MazF antagonist)